MSNEEPKCNHVLKAILEVQSHLSKDGITKSHKNQAQGYSFRGIDDIYNALSSILAKANLCIIPQLLNRTATERSTQKGGVMLHVVVDMNFHFTSAIDGSVCTVRMAGESMDTGDKATNKAMSAAYKYACMQTFCIPTEGDNDADAHSPVIKGSAPKKATIAPANSLVNENTGEILTEPSSETVRYALPYGFKDSSGKEWKNTLKAAGFYWDSAQKVWIGEVRFPALEEQLQPKKVIDHDDDIPEAFYEQEGA